MHKLGRLLPLLAAGIATGVTPVLAAQAAEPSATPGKSTGLPVALPPSGAEITRVPSSFEPDDPFDIHFGVSYDYRYKRAAILREWNSGREGDESNELVKDLIYRHQRHTLTPTVEIGLWNDLAFYASLPIVLADTRTYRFDQRADDCVFGEATQQTPTCVDRSNSTTLRDEIVPLNGIDATSSSPFGEYTNADGEMLFQGPVRRGLDQLHIGFKYGILVQDKRPHMPNWIIGAEYRAPVGRPMTFSRNLVDNDPAGNRRVGRRIHEGRIWTALSHRHRFLDPYFMAYWQPAGRANGSRFLSFSTGSQDSVQPQSSAGLSIGSELIPWERRAKDLKVSIALQGNAAIHYNGRGYSEIWELLADSPSLTGSVDPPNSGAGEAASCSRDAALAFAANNPGDPGYLEAGGPGCRKFEGITDLQDYGTFGFDAALNLHLTQYARFTAGLRMQTDTRHFITSANRGDADALPGGDPNRVESGTSEVNPIRRDVIDNVGRRYVVDDVLDLNIYLRLLITF